MTCDSTPARVPEPAAASSIVRDTPRWEASGAHAVMTWVGRQAGVAGAARQARPPGGR